MKLGPCNKTVKQYRQGNVTAAFGTELLTLGSTSIPNLLLKFYKQIGISDLEMMILIQILRLRKEEKNLNPTPENLANYLTSSMEITSNSLNKMLENEVISLTQYYDEESGKILTGYDLEPLMEKLSEIWACVKMREIEKTRFLLEAQSKNNISLGQENLYHVFEKEFGRPLSPMEIAQIQNWVEDTGNNNDLVLEALRRAVLIGKHNFKYIDSILLEWKKNNIRTLQEIEKYDLDFQYRKNKKTYRTTRGQAKTAGKDENKKEIFKTMYMS